MVVGVLFVFLLIEGFVVGEGKKLEITVSIFIVTWKLINSE